MKKRTTQPKNNPYYMRQVSGGLNGAVAGQPYISNANVLCNCFGGETKYVTDEGLKSFYETVDTTQNVLNENGEFVPAEIKSFGEQQLFKVTFSNSFSVYATANHRWVVDRFSTYKGRKYKKRVIKTTFELNDADNIPYNYFNGNGVLDIDGIVHGIVFGDGCKNNNCSTYQVQLFGNKVELKKYLPEHIRSDYDLKEVPSIYESEEYLRGFISGLLATDGTITKDTFRISSVNKEALKQIENICYKIGVHIGGIYEETRDVEVGDYEYKDHTIYYLTLKRKGIDKLLLKKSDKRKVSEQYKDIKYTRIKSIEPTDRFEEVFCAVEPITHTITLENNILTGQCVGYANGRFNEIINDPDLKGVRKAFPYQLVCNAENFIESAKRQGLKISKKPILGGIMVWQKGNTLDSWDGAGHVEVVEQVNKDGSVICSSSGWNGWAFRLLTRNNKNGSWMQESPYHFRGCIINPSIKDGDTPADEPLIVDGIGGGMTVMALQRFLNKFEDGVISGQYADQAKYRRALTAVENGGGGSSTVSALQKWLGMTGKDVDGYWSRKTSLALQKYLKSEGYDIGKDGCDAYFGHDSMCALQKFLNKQLFQK